MITVIVVKVERYGFTLPEYIQKGGDGIANSVDPDQTAPLGAVCSGSALFAQTYQSQYLEFLRLFRIKPGQVTISFITPVFLYCSCIKFHSDINLQFWTHSWIFIFLDFSGFLFILL